MQTQAMIDHYFKPITETVYFKIGEFLVYFQLRLIHKSEDRSRDTLSHLGPRILNSGKVYTLLAKPRTLKLKLNVEKEQNTLLELAQLGF